MIFPIRTDYRMTSRPWVNYILLAVNVGLFVLGFNGESQHRIANYMLQPEQMQLHQFITSVFLHMDWKHLLFNMVFLWVFGNAINDRFGNVGYLAFYLAGGVTACVGYALLSGVAPVLGASGAICAVAGAYLILLPKTRVTVIAWLLYMLVPFQISSLFFLALQFVENLWMTTTRGGGVAYAAHTAGYVFGIGISALLLAVRVLPRDGFDLLDLFLSWRRRSRYRRMVRQGFDPFASQGVGRGGEAAPKYVKTRVVDRDKAPTLDERERALRREIADACTMHDMTTATQKYMQLVQIADNAVLGRQHQLDVANYLMATEKYPAATDAYERFIKHYSDYEYIADVWLLAGLAYGRHLHQYNQAEFYLRKAIDRLSDERKLEMARAELGAIEIKRKQ